MTLTDLLNFYVNNTGIIFLIGVIYAIEQFQNCLTLVGDHNRFGYGFFLPGIVLIVMAMSYILLWPVLSAVFIIKCIRIYFNSYIF